MQNSTPHSAAPALLDAPSYVCDNQSTAVESCTVNMTANGAVACAAEGRTASRYKLTVLYRPQ